MNTPEGTVVVSVSGLENEDVEEYFRQMLDRRHGFKIVDLVVDRTGFGYVEINVTTRPRARKGTNGAVEFDSYVKTVVGECLAHVLGIKTLPLVR